MRRDKSLLWPNGIVYYSYHTSVSNENRNKIYEAIQKIQRTTCLRFYQRSSGDYIEFTSVGNGCSSRVGRTGGKQLITLSENCFNNNGTVIHEICHALGMWHEQSRPDRNSYVRVIQENIIPNKTHNFRKRTTYEVDYHGEGYDYGSIMHYGANYFSVNRNELNTLEIVNMVEYNRQGAELGQRKKLSDSDKRQLNRMYNCPGSGVPGILKVYVKYGRGLPDRDGLFAGDSDPYVKVKAVDDSS